MQAPVWAATVKEHVKKLQSKVEASSSLETLAVKAEVDLQTTRELVQVVSDQE